jgi:hypothetical protein
MVVKVGFARDTHLSIHMFEIIGTPVAEGSAEWALYQMMQGKKVCNPTLAAEKATRLGSYDVKQFNTFWYIVGDAVVEGECNYGTLSVSSWIAAASSTGWQIYKEPKPLLADAKEGWLVELSTGAWNQVEEIVFTNDTVPLRYVLKDVVECGSARTRAFGIDGRHYSFYSGLCSGFSTTIISTEPLAPEGTAEWAWQMAKLGIETKCHEGKIRVSKSGLIEVCYNGMAYAMPLTQSKENRQYAIDKISECSPDGWQLCEPEPESKYKVGDWIEWSEGLGITYQSQITRVSQSAVYSKGICIPLKTITRKLKPSEVIVKIGCLSGTVRPVSINGIHIWFQLIGVDDKIIATIRIISLDTQTRELVEGLLKAQKNKENA